MRLPAFPKLVQQAVLTAVSQILLYRTLYAYVKTTIIPLTTPAASDIAYLTAYLTNLCQHVLAAFSTMLTMLTTSLNLLTTGGDQFNFSSEVKIAQPVLTLSSEVIILTFLFLLTSSPKIYKSILTIQATHYASIAPPYVSTLLGSFAHEHEECLKADGATEGIVKRR